MHMSHELNFNLFNIFNLAHQNRKHYDVCDQKRSGSACTLSQSENGLSFSLTESLNTYIKLVGSVYTDRISLKDDFSWTDFFFKTLAYQSLRRCQNGTLRPRL